MCKESGQAHDSAIAIMVAIVVMAVIAIPTMFVLVLVTAVTMTLLVTRHVVLLVPVVPHEVDPLATGVVLTAVFAPVFLMARADVQIDRRAGNHDPFDYNRLSIDDLRPRKVSDIDTAIKAGLADVDGYANVGGEYRRGGGG